MPKKVEPHEHIFQGFRGKDGSFQMCVICGKQKKVGERNG